MAKKTVRRSKSQGSKAQNQATKTRSEATEITRWTCAFDNINGTESSLALVRSGVNGHQLRIIDIHTGTQRSEHLTENGVKIRSVAWGQLPSADKKNAGGSKQVVVALALQNGQIQIYSPARDTVVKTLEGEHENPVVDLAFGPDGSGQLVSVDESGLLVQWDIAVGSALNQINTGIHEARKLIVSSDGQRAVIGSHKLEMWDLGKQSMLQSWPGHTSPIFSLEWAADETALVSAAENDRHVQIWDASPTASSATVMRARAILAIDSDVVYAHVSVDGSVLAIGEDGVMYVWHQVAVAQRDGSAKAKSDIGQAADGVVRILSSEDADKTVAILLARFSRVSGDEGQVMIIRGSALMPVFETLSIVDSTGQFERSLVLTRAPQKNILVSSARSEAEQKLAKQQQKYDDTSASVISPVVEAVAKSQKVASESSRQEMPSLAERVKQLSAGTDDEDAEMQDGKVGKQLTVGTLVRVLVQALHTDDQEMLNMVIDNSSRTNVVRDTVLGLPTMYVLSFLQQLFVRFQTTPAKASTLLPWIRTTLTLHSAYLTTIPNLIPQLSGFYQGVEARLETHQKLLRLNGRLELVHTQIRTRELVEKDKSGRKLAQQSAPVKKSKAMKPLNVYRESDSEDEEEVDAAAAWQAEESTDDDADMASDAESDNQWSDGEEEIDGVEAAASDDEDEDEGDESGSEQSGEEDDLEQFD
ncbi:Small subunit (SSU) processome component [Linderina pennispora]|nr:Small subunit (SSU) processome component [Linderina pennispora]